MTQKSLQSWRWSGPGLEWGSFYPELMTLLSGSTGKGLKLEGAVVVLGCERWAGATTYGPRSTNPTARDVPRARDPAALWVPPQTGTAFSFESEFSTHIV